MMFPLVLLTLGIFTVSFYSLLYTLEKWEDEMTEAVNQAFDLSNSEGE